MAAEFADTVRVLPRGICRIAPMTEVAVVGGFRVDRAPQAELPNNFRRAEIKCFMHSFFDALKVDFFGPKSIQANGNGMRVTNGVGELDFHPVGQPSGDNVFCDVTSHVGGAPIDFRWILAAECASAVTARTPVGVDDDLPSGQAAVSFRAADDEPAGGVDEKLGPAIEHVFGENLADEFFDDEFFNLAVGNIFRMLGGNNDRRDPDRFALTVLNRDLGFGIGAKPRGFSGFTDPAEFPAETVGKHDGGGHEFRSFPARKAKHEALVSSALFRAFFTGNAAGIHALGDIRALAREGVHDVDAVGMKDVVIVGISDFPDGGADDLVVIELGASGDLAGNDNKVGFDQGFTGHPAHWILGQAGVQHGIRNGVANLVRMTFAHRLG